jgi:hypothetical protein
MFRSKKGGRYVLKDDKRPHKNELMRPSFSKEPGCWIIDYVFNLTTTFQDVWFFAVNMNTRYLFVKNVHGKTEKATNDAIMELIALLGNRQMFPNTVGVRNIVGDGEAAFNSNYQKWFMKEFNITFYFNSSPYTYHNKILDRCVRTIRDAFAYKKVRRDDVQPMVDCYNNTYHKSIDCTPYKMTADVNLEWQYIRYCREKLDIILNNQRYLSNYEPGNILMIHLEQARTADRFEKQRRYWNRIGRFVEYVHGNVRVLIFGPGIQAPNDVVVPIYFTKFIAKDWDSIPERVLTTYQTLLPTVH